MSVERHYFESLSTLQPGNRYHSWIDSGIGSEEYTEKGEK